MGVHAGLSTSDSSDTYLSSFGNDWSPRSRSRNRYRGGKGSTSVSRSVIVETGGVQEHDPAADFPRSGPPARTRQHPLTARTLAGRAPTPASCFRASATPRGGGTSTCRGGAEGGAMKGRGAFRVLWALHEALFLPPQDVWRFGDGSGHG